MANEPKREIMTDAKRELIDNARHSLQAKIDKLNEAGWHNQFDYENYGVQYNPVYDKKTGRVKSFAESGLSSSKSYLRLTRLMSSAPELTEQWNVDRARRIGGEVFDTYSKNSNIINTKEARDEFIKRYIEAVKKYHQDDEDFNYEVIKSLFTDLPRADMVQASAEHHESMRLGMISPV